VERNPKHYAALVGAYHNASQWTAVLALVADMQTAAIPCSTHVYNCALASLSRCGQWGQAANVLQQMRAAAVQMNSATYREGVAALYKAREYNAVLNLYHEMAANREVPLIDHPTRLFASTT
jgi:pentatricopeptide repeat protein